MSPTVYTWTGRGQSSRVPSGTRCTFRTRAGLWCLIKGVARRASPSTGRRDPRSNSGPPTATAPTRSSPLRHPLVVTTPGRRHPDPCSSGIMDNHSVFTVFRRALRRRGFGVVHAVSTACSPVTCGTRHELAGHVERLCRTTSADKGAHRRALARRRHRPLLRPADGRLGASTPSSALGQPHSRHAQRPPHPHGAGSSAAPRLAAAHRAGRARPDYCGSWSSRSRMDQMGSAQRNARLQHRTSTSPSWSCATSATWRSRSTVGSCVGWSIPCVVVTFRGDTTTLRFSKRSPTPPPERHAGPGFAPVYGARYLAEARSTDDHRRQRVDPRLRRRE